MANDPMIHRVLEANHFNIFVTVCELVKVLA